MYGAAAFALASNSAPTLVEIVLPVGFFRISVGPTRPRMVQAGRIGPAAIIAGRAMRKVTAAVVLGLAALVAASGARAEVLRNIAELKEGTAMHGYLYSPEFHRAMYQSASELDRALNTPCTEQYDITVKQIFVLQPIELPDGTKKATSGNWIYRYDAARCGATRRYNLMMTAQPDGALRRGMLAPGNTLATPQLMAETIKLLKESPLGKDCPDPQVFDTTLVQPPRLVGPGAAAADDEWKETWTIHGCGRQTAVPVEFKRRAGQGTSITVQTP